MKDYVYYMITTANGEVWFEDHSETIADAEAGALNQFGDGCIVKEFRTKEDVR